MVSSKILLLLDSVSVSESLWFFFVAWELGEGASILPLSFIRGRSGQQDPLFSFFRGH